VPPLAPLPAARAGQVHYAATIAGMAFANAFLGICHSMAHKARPAVGADQQRPLFGGCLGAWLCGGWDEQRA
jgi:hypothetical protein